MAAAGMAFVLTALVAPPVLAGQGKKQRPSASKPAAVSAAAGKSVYEQNKCANCHAIAGKGGKSGPDLSNEGAMPKHTQSWLEAEIKDPKSHKADSSMPAYGERVTGKDLSNLAAYLHSLKKAK